MFTWCKQRTYASATVGIFCCIPKDRWMKFCVATVDFRSKNCQNVLKIWNIYWFSPQNHHKVIESSGKTVAFQIWRYIFFKVTFFFVRGWWLPNKRFCVVLGDFWTRRIAFFVVRYSVHVWKVKWRNIDRLVIGYSFKGVTCC